jgi:hypothetical protein
MNRQSKLFGVKRGAREKQPPGIENRKGELKGKPLMFTFATHVNKGKVYPYASWRQGDRRQWQHV